MKSLIAYLASRPDATTFLLPSDLERSLRELFPRGRSCCRSRTTSFRPTRRSRRPRFPVAEALVMKELETKLDRWLTEETACQVNRAAVEGKAQAAMGAYVTQLMKVAENALMSNVLTDYHAVFWLAHSIDLARHFSAITPPRERRRHGPSDARRATRSSPHLRPLGTATPASR
jgi:hypothetical protein